MEFVRKKLTDVIPAPYNPRSISKAEKSKLKASIRKYGLQRPIVWNRRTNYIVGGNQTWLVLKEMGIEEEDFIAVDMPLEEEKLLNMALNKISGEWDMLKLRDLLSTLKTSNADLSLSGFDEREIAVLLSTLSAPNINEEWGGMPKFNMENAEGRTIMMHFLTDKDVNDFAKLIGQKIMPKTTFLYFPEPVKVDHTTMKYEAMKKGNGGEKGNGKGDMLPPINGVGFLLHSCSIH